ncbi:hypothetical protein CAPTEDRAFT_217380 [Capitella teleta]|uniref:LRRCT domain-containing protein n=1 Tax=Capitella teleta TaxID=283909 RepID=R7T9L1_CAPTE|nr:hypothetical protein CAPTEDRAFT_217380 [Capitella teleta]|eukprot:ELT90384.1 hypothetical protein CAPTEDRAFT_217380 [Capitella teleta]
MEIRHVALLLICLLKLKNIFSITQIFDGEGLASVPSSIYPNVTELSCQANSITVIQQSDFNNKYPDLFSIDLDDNHISSIEVGCFTGTVLKKIWLAKNDLSAIPDFREVGETLENIDLGINRIAILEVGDLNYLTRLLSLNLRYNLITSVADGSFEGTKLRYVALQNNQITKFPDLRAVNSTMQILDLEFNNIGQISRQEIDHLGILETMKLKGNPISLLPDLTEYLPLLKILVLTATPLQCCCSMAWLKQITNGLSLDSLPCKSPSKWNQLTWNEIAGDMIEKEPCEIDASHWISCQRRRRSWSFHSGFINPSLDHAVITFDY